LLWIHILLSPLSRIRALLSPLLRIHVTLCPLLRHTLSCLLRYTKALTDILLQIRTLRFTT
jgi:hypothetical protein